MSTILESGEQQIGRTVAITRSLEEILDTRFGATGKGLHEKATSVSHLVPDQLIRQLRFIASVRNKMMHSNFVMNANDFERFSNTSKTVLDQLSVAAANFESQKRNGKIGGTSSVRTGKSSSRWALFPLVATLVAGGYLILSPSKPTQVPADADSDIAASAPSAPPAAASAVARRQPQQVADTAKPENANADPIVEMKTVERTPRHVRQHITGGSHTPAENGQGRMKMSNDPVQDQSETTNHGGEQPRLQEVRDLTRGL
ncbi:MAG TPA: hypothetical protein VJ654_20760 [Noviherbaspirillum sp.]|nr:hypothetical protein [Noviherbaspirillum sp.]